MSRAGEVEGEEEERARERRPLTLTLNVGGVEGGREGALPKDGSVGFGEIEIGG